MKEATTVGGVQFTKDMLEKIEMTVQCEPGLSRRKLSRRVCEWMDWKSPNGKLAEMSCRAALLQLHRQGVLSLPESRYPGGEADYRRVPESYEPVGELKLSVDQLEDLELIPVDSRNRKLSQLWNYLVETHHYLGAGGLCGAQQRYLISSERGYLGAVSFSAAAWALGPRDRYIGWSQTARRSKLPLVVNNSRFLILPGVEIKNLASKVLALCTKRLPRDWQARHGYEPVLVESFVEQDRFAGTCYRAANWECIGQTQGRGRQDRGRERGVPVKAIYLYALRSDFRSVLCEEPTEDVRSKAEKRLSGEESVVSQDWADEEFGRAALQDDRLKNRLLIMARDFYSRPEANVPEACGTRAKTKAAYRFFDNKKVTMRTVLGSHYEATAKRASEKKIVLAVQDTTSLNYSTHPATERLGLIGYRQNGGIGLMVHDTLALTPEGVPLGLLDVQVWARDPEQFGKKQLRSQLPIEQKESMKWLRSFEAAARGQSQYPETMFVSVGDREADIYELFKLALQDERQPKLLVRAEYDRILSDGQKFWSYVENLPMSGIQELQVPRRRGRSARVAQLEIRFGEVELAAPKKKRGLGPLKIWAVLASERGAPDGVEPLKWMLLTTLEVNNFEGAVEKLSWYAKRWQIEVYHRTLKSGCQIEERQLGSADRIEACLAIDMVVAWRILHLTHLGRETPDVPCSIYFEEHEWKALYGFAHKTPEAPDEPMSLHEAIRMVASLGGFLGRKSDGDPGTKSLWVGLQRLDDIAAAWQIFSQATGPP